MAVCKRCEMQSPDEANYCANCGARLRPRAFSRQLTARSAVAVLLIALVAWGVGWSSQSGLLGSKPQPAPERPAMSAGHDSAAPDPALKNFYDDAAAHPEDVSKRKALAQALVAKLESAQQPSPGSVIETINALREVLKRSPQDPEALLAMANISFASSVFEKAQEYYSRYLEVRPGDLKVRGEYGAALLMLNKDQEAIAQLQQVLDKEPADFHALVNLSVALLRSGRTDDYRLTAERALTSAPEREREQLKTFFAGLEQKKEEGPKEESPAGETAGKAAQ